MYKLDEQTGKIKEEIVATGSAQEFLAAYTKAQKSGYKVELTDNGYTVETEFVVNKTLQPLFHKLLAKIAKLESLVGTDSTGEGATEQTKGKSGRSKSFNHDLAQEMKERIIDHSKKGKKPTIMTGEPLVKALSTMNVAELNALMSNIYKSGKSEVKRECLLRLIALKELTVEQANTQLHSDNEIVAPKGGNKKAGEK